MVTSRIGWLGVVLSSARFRGSVALWLALVAVAGGSVNQLRVDSARSEAEAAREASAAAVATIDAELARSGAQARLERLDRTAESVIDDASLVPRRSGVADPDLPPPVVVDLDDPTVAVELLTELQRLRDSIVLDDAAVRVAELEQAEWARRRDALGDQQLDLTTSIAVLALAAFLGGLALATERRSLRSVFVVASFALALGATLSALAVSTRHIPPVSDDAIRSLADGERAVADGDLATAVDRFSAAEVAAPWLDLATVRRIEVEALRGGPGQERINLTSLDPAARSALAAALTDAGVGVGASDRAALELLGQLLLLDGDFDAAARVFARGAASGPEVPAFATGSALAELGRSGDVDGVVRAGADIPVDPLAVRADPTVRDPEWQRMHGWLERLVELDAVEPDVRDRLAGQLVVEEVLGVAAAGSSGVAGSASVLDTLDIGVIEIVDLELTDIDLTRSTVTVLAFERPDEGDSWRAAGLDSTAFAAEPTAADAPSVGLTIDRRGCPGHDLRVDVFVDDRLTDRRVFAGRGVTLARLDETRESSIEACVPSDWRMDELLLPTSGTDHLVELAIELRRPELAADRPPQSSQIAAASDPASGASVRITSHDLGVGDLDLVGAVDEVGLELPGRPEPVAEWSISFAGFDVDTRRVVHDDGAIWLAIGTDEEGSQSLQVVEFGGPPAEVAELERSVWPTTVVGRAVLTISVLEAVDG